MTITGISTAALPIIRDVQKSILVAHLTIPPVYVFKLVDSSFMNTLYRSALEVVEHAHRSEI